VTEPSGLLLTALGYLLLKHMAADFILQTRYQLRNKGTYGHPGGLLHAAIHGVLSAPVFVILAPSSAAVAVVLLAGEAVLHYHIDWLKERVVKGAGWTARDSGFWTALGVDQLAHHITYLAMVALLIWW